MVSTRKKRQSNRKLLSQLDDFGQYINIGNAASERQGNITLNEGTNDQDFTGRDVTNVTANSERGAPVGINAFLKTHLETTIYYMYQL